MTPKLEIQTYGERTIYTWREGNYVSRKDGPAIAEYVNYVAVVERWLLNGLVHRTDGPAVIYRDSAGNIVEERYFLHGKKISKFFTVLKSYKEALM